MTYPPERRHNVGHHPTLAPSSFPAIMECACFRSGGSIEDGVDTTKGTLMHQYCAAYLAGQRPEIVGLYRGDIEDCEYVVDAVKDMVHKIMPGAAFEIEQEVQLLDDVMNVVTFGTRDVGAHDSELCVVVDWKGALNGTVDGHEYREQLACYALCDMRRHGLKRAMCIEAYIKPQKLFPYILSYDEAAAIVECVIQRRNDPGKKPQPCRYCKWCADLLACPEVNKRIEVIHKSFPQLMAPDKLCNPGTITDPQEMSTALIFAKVLLVQYIKRLNTMKDQIEEAALAMEISGTHVPRFELKIKEGRKEVVNISEAFHLLGMTADEFFPAMSVSLPKLAEAYAAKTGQKIKGARTEIERLLDEWIDTGKAKQSMEWIDK